MERFLLSNINELLNSKKLVNDDTVDVSTDVKQNEYPNYQITDYKSHGDRANLDPFHKIIAGGAIGLISGVFFGGSYYLIKYQREGYRAIRLIERLTVPFIKIVFCGTLLGMAVGVQNMFSQPDHNHRELHSQTH